MGLSFKCLREEVFTHEPQSELLKLISILRSSQFLIPTLRPLVREESVGLQESRESGAINNSGLHLRHPHKQLLPRPPLRQFRWFGQSITSITGTNLGP